MFRIINSISAWWRQLAGAIHDQVTHLDPQEYTIGLVFCIAIGYVLLNGRR